MRLSTGTTLVLVVCGAVVVALATGQLSFLRDATAWQLGFSVLPQSPSDPYVVTLAIAVLNTVCVAGTAIALATVTGTLIAFVAIAGNRAWSRMAAGYVQFFRNMPLILQALFWFAVITHLPGPRQALHLGPIALSNRGASLPFPTTAGLSATTAFVVGTAVVHLLLRRAGQHHRYRVWLMLAVGAATAAGVWLIGFPSDAFWSVPELTGFNFVGGIQLPTELIALLIALAMFGSAYIAEIVRGGLETVPKGLIEAARALGLPAWVVEAKIRVPLALRAIILPLGSQFTTLTKATSIGLAIGFTDLFAVTLMSINQSGHTLALLSVMTACFVLLNQAIVSGANALNRAFQLPGAS